MKKENNIKKVVEKFNYKLYCSDGNFKIYTKEGKPVSIIDTWRLYKGSDDEYIIGLIDEGDRLVPNTWDINGNDFTSNDYSKNKLELVKYVKPNYDHITEKDVPDTDEFKTAYENSQKYSYKLSPVEYLRYKEFCKDHRNCCRDTGAIGGGISISFMSTGLGNIVHATCEVCGTEVDITDSECW